MNSQKLLRTLLGEVVFFFGSGFVSSGESTLGFFEVGELFFTSTALRFLHCEEHTMFNVEQFDRWIMVCTNCTDSAQSQTAVRYLLWWTRMCSV